MNERIKELAKQSGFRSSVAVTDGNDKDIVTPIGKGLERFAELIVRECVEVMKQHSFHQRTQNAVLEHFGVK